MHFNVTDYLPPWAAAARLGSFAGILIIMAFWEIAAPRRKVPADRPRRWATNLGFSAVNTIISYLVVPVMPLALAFAAQAEGWGLLNRVTLPWPVSAVIAVIALDFIIYLQHLMFHSVPLLWRLHMTHHTDLHIDATTGLRFHPVEILVSLAVKLGAVAALGPSPLAVLIFEILLNGTSLFNHGNVHIPAGLDRILRLVVVTPDMHRVHHSVAIRETNCNFGFNLTWWDRIMGTYRPVPAAGHEKITVGIATQRTPVYFLKLMLFPVTGDPGRYPLTGHGGEPGKNP